MGTTSAWERIGVGVMDKAGVSTDHTQYTPATWSIIYVLRGQGTYHDTSSGVAWPIQAGDCFQRVPGLQHTTHIDPTSQWLEAWIDFGPSLFAAMRTMQMIRPDPRVWHWGLAPERIARFAGLMRALDVASISDLPELCVRCQTLAIEALQAAERHGDNHNDPVDRFCRILADEATTRLSLRHLCARERIDYEWLRKSFQQRTGLSPSQYRIRRRIDHACSLLHTTNLSIAAISERLGYASAYEFSNQFRQWMRVAPSVYR